MSDDGRGGFHFWCLESSSAFLDHSFTPGFLDTGFFVDVVEERVGRLGDSRDSRNEVSLIGIGFISGGGSPGCRVFGSVSCRSGGRTDIIKVSFDFWSGVGAISAEGSFALGPGARWALALLLRFDIGLISSARGETASAQLLGVMRGWAWGTNFRESGSFLVNVLKWDARRRGRGQRDLGGQRRTMGATLGLRRASYVHGGSRGWSLGFSFSSGAGLRRLLALRYFVSRGARIKEFFTIGFASARGT